MTKLFRGGGTIADTISNVPEAIDGMLAQYKKIAISGKQEIRLPSLNQRYTLTINTNLNFNPSMIFCSIWMKSSSEYRYCGTVDSRYNLETDKNDGDMKNYFISAKFLSDSINSKNFKMDLYSDKKYDYEISWIAIE